MVLTPKLLEKLMVVKKHVSTSLPLVIGGQKGLGRRK